MSLEEYKKRATDWMKKSYPNTTKTVAYLQTMTDELWLKYMEDFSPEAMIVGRQMGLI